jgi:hypothetical protein
MEVATAETGAEDCYLELCGGGACDGSAFCANVVGGVEDGCMDGCCHVGDVRSDWSKLCAMFYVSKNKKVKFG